MSTTVNIIMGKIDDAAKRGRVYRLLIGWAGRFGGGTTINDQGFNLHVASVFEDAEKAAQYEIDLRSFLKQEN